MGNYLRWLFNLFDSQHGTKLTVAVQRIRAIDDRVRKCNLWPAGTYRVTLLHIQCGQRNTMLTGPYLIRHFGKEFNVERRFDLRAKFSEIPFGAERPVQIGWKITIRIINRTENVLRSPTIQFWRPPIYLATSGSISSPQEGTSWRSRSNRSKLPFHRSPMKFMASWRVVPMSCITTGTML